MHAIEGTEVVGVEEAARARDCPVYSEDRLRTMFCLRTKRCMGLSRVSVVPIPVPARSFSQ